MEVKIKKLHPKASIPTRATNFAGGWDVTCTEIIQQDNDFVICKLGFALEVPVGYKVTLVPRSSITKTHWIQQNSPGLGDCDYRGEYQYRFRALPIGYGLEELPSSTKYQKNYERVLAYPKFPFSVGDRIGQVYLEEVLPISFVLVDELEDTVRGGGGFGSTGL
jgi:dUTP pyrophosphatase